MGWVSVVCCFPQLSASPSSLAELPSTGQLHQRGWGPRHRAFFLSPNIRSLADSISECQPFHRLCRSALAPQGAAVGYLVHTPVFSRHLRHLPLKKAHHRFLVHRLCNSCPQSYQQKLWISLWETAQEAWIHEQAIFVRCGKTDTKRYLFVENAGWVITTISV